jgi:LuxR family transcriptional regulator, maltose regulon positive regulatory protein
MPAALRNSKLYIPPIRPDRVPRQRLIEHLNAGEACKLTLISAPAGFGKTTLISEWIASLGQPAAWISLDKADNDLGRFLTYLVVALRPLRPGFGAATLALIEASGYGAARLALEPTLAGLVNELGEMAAPLYLVLDDYHVISQPEIHEALKFILEGMPARMHLVLSSRADPPWPLALLRAHNELNEVRVSDLRFTTEEAAAFLNDAMKLNLQPEAIDALEERTEGWIAGLQMAALSMRGRPDKQDFITAFAGSHHFIADFLVEEVLNQQPEDLRQFLLKASILERLNAGLCDALTGRSDGRALLARLEQANLFLIGMDDERKWFRFHHLFRDLLRASLETLLPAEVPGLHRSASRWYAAAGMHEEAIGHAFAALDFELAAGQIEQAASQLDIENKIVIIDRWIEALPVELIRARPWLCVYRAWGCYWTGQREQVEPWLGAAEQGLLAAAEPGSAAPGLPAQSAADHQHITGHIAAIRSHYALTNEDIPGVIENSQRALELLPEGDDMRTETAVALGGAYWGLGDVAAAERTFSKARSNALKGGNASLVVPSSCYVGMQQTKQGRLKEAMQTYRDALHYATTPGGLELPAAGFPNIKIGDLLREWNRLDEATPYLERGVEQCQLLGQADVLADGFVALARLQMAQGGLSRAQETLSRARQVKERTKIDPFVQCWLDDCQLRLWLCQGDFDAAARWAKTCGLTPDSPLSFHYDLNHLNLARLLLDQARRDPAGPALPDARRLLGRLLPAAEQAGWVQEEIKALILLGRACQIGGDAGGGMQALETSLRLAEHGGYLRLFLDEDSELGPLLEACRLKLAKSSPDLAPYLESLAGEYPHPAPLAAPLSAAQLRRALPEPLTEREQEVLRLLASSMTSSEIAGVLFVAPSTVRTHIKSIYGKLAANRRLEAIQKAKDLGLLH